jgi:uncharacterized protein (TIGR00251 family)
VSTNQPRTQSIEVVDTPAGAVLSVHTVPRAGRSAVSGVRDGRVLVRLAASPVDGEANRELIELLSGILKTPRTQIRLVRGHGARRKRLLIEGLSAAAVVQRLAAVLVNQP